jgi:CheY-like chemotaxis protein
MPDDSDNASRRQSSDQRGSAGHGHLSLAATSSYSGGSPDHRPAVLLVEDDPDVAEMYRLRLEIATMDVTVARDGDEALRIATTLAHDLVLMDLNLPKMSGLEVIARLRQNEATRNLPLVVLSAYGDPDTVERAQQLGVLAYLVKSDTSPAALVSRVREWLR